LVVILLWPLSLGLRLSGGAAAVLEFVESVTAGKMQQAAGERDGRRREEGGRSQKQKRKTEATMTASQQATHQGPCSLCSKGR